jgi:predicted GNAT family N-acyltransferase
MSDDPGIEHVTKLYHLYGENDPTVLAAARVATTSEAKAYEASRIAVAEAEKAAKAAKKAKTA